MSPSKLLVQIQAHRQILNLPHIDLSYLEWNQGQEPLLLLHGLADSSAVWLSLAESLQDRYHIIAPDLRGHGDSSKPANGYRCGDIIADLEALMDSAGWRSTHAIAHSWSAKVVAVWARQKPQRLRSAILVDPFFIDRMPNWLGLTLPIIYRTLPFLKTMGPFASYELAEQQARQLKQYRGWSDLQQAVFRASMEQKPNGRWGSKFVVQARDEIFEDTMQVTGLTEPLEIPTLFLQPDGGLNRLEWQLKSYRTYLKNLQIQKIPGNHWTFLVEPLAFNQAVADFLEKHSA
ncbi:alpha/beta fold hydrolase [Pseudanabaena sp. PCC 6802]|uniref:alpha/beta fold hydrolase n=1 Tax=Pseudanabaena sp. PCC 6802 TaxID=118173 RepID=UPI000373B293|nr:alpha/beta hydrolase [Pseudanabaena sp. PCC 6802]